VRNTNLNNQQSLSYKTALILLVLGALLRIAQYLAATSLWGDELSIVRNLTSKDLFGLLTRPLSDEQIAPPGFLVLLKLQVTLTSTSEYSLRFIPLLSSLVALALFASLARKLFSREALLLALAAFSTSIPLIRYAGQVKPYSSDVVASLVCLLVAYSWMEANNRRTALWAAATGAIVVWFSYPSVFTLAAVGVFALWRSRTVEPAASVKQIVQVFGTWLTSFLALAAFEYRRTSPSTQSYMRLFWADWMMPEAPTLPNIGAWLVRVTRDFLSDFLHLPKWPALCLLLLVGIFYLFRRHGSGALLLVGPILVAFVASAMRYYPFRGRVILFLVPNVLLLLTAGMLAVTRAVAHLRVPRWGQHAIFLVAALAIGVRPLWKNPPPYRDSETKPMLSYLGEHRRDGDGIYVDAMAWHAFEFYGPRFSLSMEQARISSLKGNTTVLVPDPLVILKDLDAFRGYKRLWVLFGGAYGDQVTAPIWYLDSIGHRLDCRSSYNASLYLYDLSDSRRFNLVEPEDFLITTPQPKACEK
jgi:hypothetical protein